MGTGASGLFKNTKGSDEKNISNKFLAGQIAGTLITQIATVANDVVQQTKNAWGTTDDLINSATAPGKGGVSPVGRAYQKHAGNPSRAGTFTGKVSGNATQNTQK